jgi:hypothetical protein
MIDWMDGKALDRVPAGQFGDRALAYLGDLMKAGQEQPETVRAWAERNVHGLRDYWAFDKEGALAVKAKVEEALAFQAPAEAA